MAKKMSSLVRKILSEVGRNEMLSWLLLHKIVKLLHVFIYLRKKTKR